MKSAKNLRANIKEVHLDYST